MIAACALPSLATETQEDAGEQLPARNLEGASAPASNGAPQSMRVGQFEDAIRKAAAAFELPVSFFSRLIWQESRFDPKAVSPAGAQGIAQFMPGTARWRGLADPFAPDVALQESARWLRELWSEFGNLGLAAAAYNAGPGAVEAWLAGRSILPFETQAYVRIVTGYAAEAWTAKPTPQMDSSAAPAGERCAEIAKALMESVRRRLPLSSSPAWGPWGIQLAGNWSEGGVLAAYERLRRRYASVLGDRLPLVMYARRGAGATFVVRVSEKTRADADTLCAKLRAAGGACVVLRNPRD